MDDQFKISINNYTLEKITKKKYDMGFANKNWDEWFDELINEPKNRNTNEIIEDTFQKVTYEKWFDQWIKNFAINLNDIWEGKSARKLTPNINVDENKFTPSIVIGRGPSITKHKHLELLSESKFSGSIICTDGALKNVLKSGVTPEKFENFFVVTIDAQDIQLDLYLDPIIEKYGNKIKAIFSTATSPKVISKAKELGMEIFWLHTLIDYDKGKLSFNHISSIMTKCKNHINGLPAIQTAGNVGSSCWVIAWSILKSSPVGLIGLDHAYLSETPWEEITKNHNLDESLSYESKLFKNAYPTGYNPDFQCHYKQTPQFQYYSTAFKEFIPLAPKWVKTINATEGGAIHGEKIHSMTFRNFLQQYSI